MKISQNNFFSANKMPKLDMPVDDGDSVDSSLVSFSSNENGVASNRSLSSSISFGPASNHSPPLLMVDRKSPLPPPFDLSSVCQEPTIDAVLVKYPLFPFLQCQKFDFFFDFCQNKFREKSVKGPIWIN